VSRPASAAARKRKPVLVPGVKPWACVTLNVDCGESCGVAIYNQGVYYDSGHGDGYSDSWIAGWLERALFVMRRTNLPLVLVLEKPPMGGKPYPATKNKPQRSPAGAASVLGCRKLWLRVWNRSDGVCKRYHIDVVPPTWRGPVLGSLVDPQPRERLRASIEKHNNASMAKIMQQDECAAICIGVWSSNAEPVAAVLPKKLRLRVGSRP
jgi:hypothetical protein